VSLSLCCVCVLLLSCKELVAMRQDLMKQYPDEAQSIPKPEFW